MLFFRENFGVQKVAILFLCSLSLFSAPCAVAGGMTVPMLSVPARFGIGKKAIGIGALACSAVAAWKLIPYACGLYRRHYVKPRIKALDGDLAAFEGQIAQIESTFWLEVMFFHMVRRISAASGMTPVERLIKQNALIERYKKEYVRRFSNIASYYEQCYHSAKSEKEVLNALASCGEVCKEMGAGIYYARKEEGLWDVFYTRVGRRRALSRSTYKSEAQVDKIIEICTSIIAKEELNGMSWFGSDAYNMYWGKRLVNSQIYQGIRSEELKFQAELASRVCSGLECYKQANEHAQFVHGLFMHNIKNRSIDEYIELLYNMHYDRAPGWLQSIMLKHMYEIYDSWAS